MRAGLVVVCALTTACRHRVAPATPPTASTPTASTPTTSPPTPTARPHASPIAAPPRPAPTVIASGRHEPKHLVADVTGATWVEATDDVSTIVHVTKAGRLTTLATVRGEIRALGLGPSGSLYASVVRGDRFSIVRVRGGKAEPYMKLDGIVDQLAVDGDALYFGGGGGDFSRVAFKGHANQIASSVEYSFADHMAVDDTFLYWSNELDDTPRRIYRVPKLGGEVEQVSTTAVGVWTLGDQGPMLVTDDVSEAAYAGGVTWALWDSNVVVLAP